MRNSVHGLMRPALIWLALFSGISTFLFWTNIVSTVKVIRHHQTTEGTITQLLPAEHRTVVATYEIDGHSYTVATSLPDQLGLAPFERLKLGNKVTVEYSPAAPAHGILGSAQKLLAPDIKDIGLLAIFLLLAAAFLEFNIRQVARKSRGTITADKPNR